MGEDCFIFSPQVLFYQALSLSPVNVHGVHIGQTGSNTGTVTDYT